MSEDQGCALLFIGTGKKEWRDYVPWYKCKHGEKKTLTVLYGSISNTSAELRQQKPSDRKASVVLGRQAG